MWLCCWLCICWLCIRTCMDCRTCTLTAADIRCWCNFSASPPRAARPTASGSIGAQLLHIFSQLLHNTRVAHIIVALTPSCRGALPLMIITLSLSAQRSSQIIPSSETLHWKLLPIEILPGLGSLTIYIFRLSGWLFLQKWERKSWKKNETVAQISGRRCMTLGEVWPSFPDEGGAVQLSTLGGQEEE